MGNAVIWALQFFRLRSVKCIAMRADVDLDIGRKTFASGLLPELIAVLRRSRTGALIALVGDEESVGPALETWCRFTGNALLEASKEKGRARWVFSLRDCRNG